MYSEGAFVRQEITGTNRPITLTGMVLRVSPRILSSLSSRSNLKVSPAGNLISTALTKA